MKEVELKGNLAKYQPEWMAKYQTSRNYKIQFMFVFEKSDGLNPTRERASARKLPAKGTGVQVTYSHFLLLFQIELFRN